MIPIPYKLIAVFGLIMALFMSGYFYGRHVQGAKDSATINAERLTWGQAIAKGQEAATQAIDANDKLKTKLGVQHAQANAVLDVLLSHPTDRVQLPSTCLPSATNNQANTAGGGVAPIEANGVLFAATERILDEDRQRTKAIIGEAEQELIECRVSKDWAKAH